jgi:hypothetical protein
MTYDINCIHRTGSIDENAKNKAIDQDDALGLEWIDLHMANNKSLAFDHRNILSHYKKWRLRGYFGHQRNKIQMS